jgi:hypothetical protein
VFNESTDIDIASSTGESSQLVVVDEVLAEQAELAVLPETESYISERVESWATRDVANKRAELKEGELEVAEGNKHKLENYTLKILRNMQKKYMGNIVKPQGPGGKD